MKNSATPSSSRLGNLTAAHGWKVGAGNGPDVWGLEGELGGGVRGGQWGIRGSGGCTTRQRRAPGEQWGAPGRAPGHV